MDRDALVTRTRRLADVNFADLWSDVEVESIVNEAYLGLCAAAPWSFMAAEGTIAATVGTADYSLPAAVGVASDLWIAAPTRRRLRERPVEQFAWSSTDRAAQAEPWGWGMVDHDTVRLFPTPDTSYTVQVRGWKLPAELSTGTAEPTFEDAHHVAVAYEAARLILEAEGDDSGRAQQYLATVAWHLSRMAERYLPDGDEPVAWPPQMGAPAEEG